MRPPLFISCGSEYAIQVGTGDVSPAKTYRGGNQLNLSFAGVPRARHAVMAAQGRFIPFPKGDDGHDLVPCRLLPSVSVLVAGRSSSFAATGNVSFVNGEARYDGRAVLKRTICGSRGYAVQQGWDCYPVLGGGVRVTFRLASADCQVFQLGVELCLVISAIGEVGANYKGYRCRIENGQGRLPVFSFERGTNGSANKVHKSGLPTM